MIIYNMRQKEIKRLVMNEHTPSHAQYAMSYSLYSHFSELQDIVTKACRHTIFDVLVQDLDMVNNSEFYKSVKAEVINKVYDAVESYLIQNNYYDLDRVILIFTNLNRNQFIVELDILSVHDLQYNKSLNEIISKLIGYCVSDYFKTDRMEMVVKGEVKHYRVLPKLMREFEEAMANTTNGDKGEEE